MLKATLRSIVIASFIATPFMSFASPAAPFPPVTKSDKLSPAAPFPPVTKSDKLSPAAPFPPVTKSTKE